MTPRLEAEKLILEGALAVGDYSLAGLEDKVAVERKSLPDLVLCLGRERERFERELMRGAALDAFAVLVEADWLMPVRGEYHTKLKKYVACLSVLAFTARYRGPLLPCGDSSPRLTCYEHTVC